MDLEALLEYFTFQNFFTDRTLFKGVRLLPAGCWLKLSAQGGESLFRYWDFDFREPQYPLAEADYVEEVDRLMQQALSRQLVSDVEIGSYLSGGVGARTPTPRATPPRADLKTFTARR